MPIDKQAAVAKVYEDVFQPVFFQKLASAGIRPSNVSEAEALLRIGQNLFAAEQIDAVKQAEESGGLYMKAAAFLDEYVGVANVEQDRHEAAAVKSAAAHFAADPAVLEAAAVAAAALAG